MSLFYNAYFLKKPMPEAAMREKFSRVDVFNDSEWITCDFGDDTLDGIFEAGHYFTKEISSQFGETIFICVDTMNDQFEYEHSNKGVILRKLCWSTDGCQSTWSWVEGEKEQWEDDTLFSEENFSRALEMVKYGEHLELLDETRFHQKKKELRSIWDNGQYLVDEKWPLGDATIGIVIQRFFGLKTPVILE